MNKSKNGVYKPDKHTSRVEVQLNSGDSYSSTAVKACNALGIGTRHRHNAEFILLRLSGTIIPHKEIEGEEWTVGKYVERIFLRKSRPNLGVFVQESVSRGTCSNFFLSAPNPHSCGFCLHCYCIGAYSLQDSEESQEEKGPSPSSNFHTGLLVKISTLERALSFGECLKACLR